MSETQSPRFRWKPLAVSFVRDHERLFPGVKPTPEDVFDHLPEPIPTPPGQWRGIGRKSHPKQCHERAARFALDNMDVPELRMCCGDYYPHGWCGEKHSWVEIGADIAFDGNAQEFFNLDEYLAAIRPRNVTTYSPIQIARISVRTGHWGPWTTADLHALEE